MQDNSSASAGRRAQAIFIFNSLELAVSTIVSKQETKSVPAIAGNRELCLYLLLALAILRHFARQIYEEQEKPWGPRLLFNSVLNQEKTQHKTLN